MAGGLHPPTFLHPRLDPWFLGVWEKIQFAMYFYASAGYHHWWSSHSSSMNHGDSSEKCTRFAFLPTLPLTFEPTPNPLRRPVPECTCVEVCGSVWGVCSVPLGHGDYRQVVGSVVCSGMATKKPSSAPVSARLDMSKCDLQAKIHPQQITTNTHM